MRLDVGMDNLEIDWARLGRSCVEDDEGSAPMSGTKKQARRKKIIVLTYGAIAKERG